jgi:hypothetical protein
MVCGVEQIYRVNYAVESVMHVKDYTDISKFGIITRLFTIEADQPNQFIFFCLKA